MSGEGSVLPNLAEYLKCSLASPLWMLSFLTSGIFVLRKQSELFCTAWCLGIGDSQWDGRFPISYFDLSLFLDEPWWSQLGDHSDLHWVPSVPVTCAEQAPATPSISILSSTSLTEIRQQLPYPPSEQREQWVAVSIKSTDGLFLNISRTFIFNFIWVNDRKDN